MFCKSGILIFIFAENNYSIYAHTMLIKTPLLHQKEKAMAPNSSTLAWKIPWTEEPGGLQSMGSLGVGYD